MPQVFVGVDVGTGSTKAVAVTATGDVVATAHRAHRVDMPHPGWAEIDPASVWDEVAAVCREVLADLHPGDVAGLCVSGMGPCLVVTGDDGTPLRPAVLYGIDGRAATQITALTERFGADPIRRRCGKDLTSQAVGPKLAWLREAEPEVWARTTRWWGLSSWIAGRLTGEYVQDHQTASQCDPLYDVTTFDWATDWLDEVTPGLTPPRLVWPHEVVGRLRPGPAEELGIPSGTPVSAGTVDAWAEAFSAGVRDERDLMLMYGSTMFLVRPVPAADPVAGLWVTAGVQPGSRTLAAGTATSGSLVQWVQDLTGASLADLEGEARGLAPGADGLLLLPYFAGERTPVQDPRASGVAVGLTLRHGRGHLLRAAYEGIAFGIRQILELVDPTGGADAADGGPRLVAVGGGTRSALLTQVVSDVCGRSQAIPEQTIGASHGSALLSAIGTGAVPAEADWSRVGSVVDPSSEAGAVYDALYPTFRDLYGDTRRHMHRLAQVAGWPDQD